MGSGGVVGVVEDKAISASSLKLKLTEAELGKKLNFFWCVGQC